MPDTHPTVVPARPASSRRAGGRHAPRRPIALATGLLAAALLALTAMVGLASPAAAHATLIGTDPEDGAVLDASPEAITLSFSEQVSPVADTVQLISADRSRTDVEVEGTGAEVRITPAETLGDGTHVLGWRVISADGHPISGALSFSVGEPTAGGVGDLTADLATDASGSLTASLRVAQTLRYAALLGGAGLLMAAALWGAGASGALSRTALGAGIATALVAPVLTLLDTAWREGGGLGDALSGSTVRAALDNPVLLESAAGAVLLLLAWWTTYAPSLPQPQRPAALFLTALAAATPAMGGHTRVYGNAVLAPLSDAVHLVAAALWVGGVVGLVLLLRPGADVALDVATGAVGRFSAAALISVGVLTASGAALILQIPGLSNLEAPSASWPPDYTTALVAKLALVLAAVAFAAYNRFALVPRLRTRGSSGRAEAAAAGHRLRRVLAAEATVLLAVLAVTTVLASTEPRPSEIAAAEAAAAGTASGSAPFAEGTVEVSAQSTGEGTIAIEVRVADNDGAPFAPVSAPQATIELPAEELGPTSTEVAFAEPGRYAGELDVPLAGEWSVGVAVRTAQFDVVQVDLEVRVE